jgi:hypothetical protein
MINIENTKGEVSNGSLVSHNETMTMAASLAHPSSIGKAMQYTVSRANCIWQNENGSWEEGPNSKCW